jgi:hypothetical protein
LKRQHSAVESAINALEVHGLDICRDHGIEGFERYVALAVLSRNIQKLGVILRDQERQRLANEKRQKALLILHPPAASTAHFRIENSGILAGAFLKTAFSVRH